MHSDLQRRVQRYGWDKAAAHYEGYWKEPLAPAQNLLMDLAALQPGERVLDVACGTGLVALEAARAVGAEGRVVGTDLSGEMVTATQQMAARENQTTISAERMDAETLSFPEDSFDVALCALGLMYVPDPMQAVREMYRVVKPGGRCVIAVWGQRSQCGWAELFPIVDRRVSSDVCPMFFQLGARGALDATFQQAGFSDVSSQRISTTFRHASEEEACGAGFLGGPVAMAYARFDEPTRAEAHQEYLDSIAPFRDGSGFEIPGEFVVGQGRKP